MANQLGDCEKCHGPLCISSKRTGQVIAGVVKCERCGNEVPDHPMTPAPLAPEAPKEVNIAPESFANSLPDRVMRLEKLVKSQGELLTAQGKRLAELERSRKVPQTAGAR